MLYDDIECLKCPMSDELRAVLETELSCRKYKHQFSRLFSAFHCMLASKMHFTSNYVLESNSKLQKSPLRGAFAW